MVMYKNFIILMIPSSGVVPEPVSEPSTMILLGSVIMGLFGFRKRSGKQSQP
jgi:hypothetical protein